MIILQFFRPMDKPCNSNTRGITWTSWLDTDFVTNFKWIIKSSTTKLSIFICFFYHIWSLGLRAVLLNIHPRNRNIWVFQGLDHSSNLERMNTDFSLLLFQFPQKVLPLQPRPPNHQCDVLFSPSSSYIVSFWAVAAKSWLSQKPIQERHPLANSIGSNPFSSDHSNIGRGLFQDPTMGSSVTTRSKVQFRKIELGANSRSFHPHRVIDIHTKMVDLWKTAISWNISYPRPLLRYPLF